MSSSPLRAGALAAVRSVFGLKERLRNRAHVRAAEKAGTGQRRLGFIAERDNLPSAA